MNCPKCIIDSGKVKRAAKHLEGMAKEWTKTIDELYDAAKSPVPLNAEEKARIVAVSQTWCDLADTINETIKASTDALCAIAVAHTDGA